MSSEEPRSAPTFNLGRSRGPQAAGHERQRLCGGEGGARPQRLVLSQHLSQKREPLSGEGLRSKARGKAGCNRTGGPGGPEHHPEAEGQERDGDGRRVASTGEVPARHGSCHRKHHGSLRIL